MGPVPCHIGLYFGKVPAVESLSHGYAVPAPFGKGAFLRPVSAACPLNLFPKKRAARLGGS